MEAKKMQGAVDVQDLLKKLRLGSVE